MDLPKTDSGETEGHGVIVAAATKGTQGRKKCLVESRPSGGTLPCARVPLLRTDSNPARSPPDCSGDHAVKDNVDGEAKPFVTIAGDHLRCVGGDNWESVGR
jgi:hypothetical protein